MNRTACMATLVLLVMAQQVIAQCRTDACLDATRWHQGYTIVILEATASIAQLRSRIESAGGRIALVVPPHILMGYLPNASILNPKEVRIVSRSLIPFDRRLSGLTSNELRAVQAFNDIVSGKAAAEVQRGLDAPPPALTGDVQPRPNGFANHSFSVATSNQQSSNSGPVARQHLRKPLPTTLYTRMIGTFYVTMFFVESAVGSGLYDWPESETETIYNQAVQALNWWSSQAAAHNPPISLTFWFETHAPFVRMCALWCGPWQYWADSPVVVPVEPILYGAREEYRYVLPIMQHFNYNQNDTFSAVSAFNAQQAVNSGTNGSFSVFVIYDPQSHRFYDTPPSAYTFLGGPYVVSLWYNDTVPPWQYNQILAHETGHNFWLCAAIGG